MRAPWPGIEPGSPARQAGMIATTLPGQKCEFYLFDKILIKVPTSYTYPKKAAAM